MPKSDSEILKLWADIRLPKELNLTLDDMSKDEKQAAIRLYRLAQEEERKRVMKTNCKKHGGSCFVECTQCHSEEKEQAEQRGFEKAHTKHSMLHEESREGCFFCEERNKGRTEGIDDVENRLAPAIKEVYEAGAHGTAERLTNAIAAASEYGNLSSEDAMWKELQKKHLDGSWQKHPERYAKNCETCRKEAAARRVKQ